MVYILASEAGWGLGWIQTQVTHNIQSLLTSVHLPHVKRLY